MSKTRQLPLRNSQSVVRGRNVINYYKKMAIVTHSLHSKRIVNRQERLYPLVLPESREKFTKIHLRRGDS